MARRGGGLERFRFRIRCQKFHKQTLPFTPDTLFWVIRAKVAKMLGHIYVVVLDPSRQSMNPTNLVSEATDQMGDLCVTGTTKTDWLHMGYQKNKLL